MTSVFVVAHHQRSEAAALVVAATTWLRANGHDAFMSLDDADALGLGELASDRDPTTAGLAISSWWSPSLRSTSLRTRGSP